MKIGGFVGRVLDETGKCIISDMVLIARYRHMLSNIQNVTYTILYTIVPKYSLCSLSVGYDP